MLASHKSTQFVAALKLAAIIAALALLLVAAAPPYPLVHVFTGGILICALLLVGGLRPVSNF